MKLSILAETTSNSPLEFQDLTQSSTSTSVCPFAISLHLAGRVIPPTPPGKLYVGGAYLRCLLSTQNSSWEALSKYMMSE